VPEAAVPGEGRGFRFRRLEKPEEFRAAEELVRSAVGDGGDAVVPAPLLRSLQDNGGLVLGAFADIYLAGCSISTIGWDGAALYHYSHATVVRPEYRNHRLGFRLKAFQRDEVLALGLSEIRWVFDPLVSRSASLFLRRLGALPDRYLPHYYGRLDDEANRGLETDRLRVRWTLADPHVAARLSGTVPAPEEDVRFWQSAAAVVETEPADSGLRVPTAVVEPSGGPAHLEIPFDLDLVRQHEGASLRRWRHAVRDAFRAAFDLGYRIDDFAVVSSAHERRSFYFLRPPARVDGGPAGSPP
jgi:predicted GNAT superfamily acetyltransferase